MKNKCVIYSAGSYGKIYAAYLEAYYHIIGFIDDDPSLIGKKVNDYSVIGNLEYLLNNLDSSISVFVPIGNNKVRVSLLKILEANNFKVPSFVHPATQIHETVKIGKGVYILPSASIMPFTTIADYTMISIGVNIAHHTAIGEGCFFSQGTNVGASIHIRKESYFGIASTVMTGVNTIGKNSLIGAGTVIISEVPDFAVVVGNPGRIIKYQEEHSYYYP